MRKEKNNPYPSLFQFQDTRSDQMNCVPKCVGKFLWANSKSKLVDFVWLNRIQTTPFRLFTKTENKYRIKRQALRSSPDKSCKNMCLYLDIEHWKKIMIFENLRQYMRSYEFLHNKKKRGRWGWGTRQAWKRKGQLQISLLNPQQKSIPTMSFCVTNSCVDSHSQTLFWFAPICKVHFHFFLSLSLLRVFFPPRHNFSDSVRPFSLSSSCRVLFVPLLWMLLGYVDKQIISHFLQRLH